MTLIAFTGIAGSGKGAATDFLRSELNAHSRSGNNTTVVSFAEPLRQLFLRSLGLSSDKLSLEYKATLDRDTKELPIIEVFPKIDVKFALENVESALNLLSKKHGDLEITSADIEYLLRILYTPSGEVKPDLTIRKALQVIGTEFGREFLKDSLWIDLAEATISDELSINRDAIVDDCRFNNEALLIHKLKGKVIEIQRPSITGAGNHKSEAGIDRCLVDKIIVNDKGLEDLRLEVEGLV